MPASFLTNGKGPPSTARLTRGQLQAIARNLTNQQSESRQDTYDAGQADSVFGSAAFVTVKAHSESFSTSEEIEDS